MGKFPRDLNASTEASKFDYCLRFVFSEIDEMLDTKILEESRLSHPQGSPQNSQYSFPKSNEFNTKYRNITIKERSSNQETRVVRVGEKSKMMSARRKRLEIQPGASRTLNVADE